MSNKEFKVQLKTLEKQCKDIKVKAWLLNVFGEIVLEKEFELKVKKLEGDIWFTDFEKNSRIYLKFTTTTAGLLECYEKVRIGESTAIEFNNPLDITGEFRDSCDETRTNIHLLSSFVFGQCQFSQVCHFPGLIVQLFFSWLQGPNSQHSDYWLLLSWVQL